MSTNPKPDRVRGSTSKPKIHPITNPVDISKTGLPVSLDAERLVLGSVLLDDTRFLEIAALDPDNFSLERHRRIFRRMQDLQARGEHIDRVTVAEELARHDELGPDGLSYLTSLDDGLPHIPHLDAYVRIVLKKSRLRQAIVSMRKAMDECLLETAEPATILANHLAEIEDLRASLGRGRAIRRVEDLASTFAARVPTGYLIKPELPVKAIVCLTGDSESGKTTLACAWARDAFRDGHAILMLDHDQNPRDRICDRLERLGITSDGEFFRVWDCEQEEEAPQPDDPIIIDWVKRMVADTGKSPLVIVDSLVSFFDREEDENSAVDMRALFNRCRALTKRGATVIIIHHTNRKGEARGSSDFKPACDQAFLVSNYNRDDGRLLDVIRLQVEKSRYGLFGSIKYQYADGKMVRLEDGLPSRTVTEQFQNLLSGNPGILTQPFEELAHKHGLGRNKAREFLKTGVRNGTIEVQNEGRKRHHYWRGAKPANVGG